MNNPNFFQLYPWLFPLILILFFWELIWKLIALWRAGRNNHLAWFICIALVNSAGIVPIIYLLKQKKEKNTL